MGNRIDATVFFFGVSSWDVKSYLPRTTSSNIPSNSSTISSHPSFSTNPCAAGSTLPQLPISPINPNRLIQSIPRLIDINNPASHTRDSSIMFACAPEYIFVLLLLILSPLSLPRSQSRSPFSSLQKLLWSVTNSFQ